MAFEHLYTTGESPALKNPDTHTYNAYSHPHREEPPHFVSSLLHPYIEVTICALWTYVPIL